MKKLFLSVLSVFAVFLFPLSSTIPANAAEPQYFSPSDIIEYDVVELKLTKPGEAVAVVRNRDTKTREAEGDRSLECKLITNYKNDKQNGFYVKVPSNTWLTVGENIEVVFTDPAFAKPEDTSKDITDGEYRFYPGETVFFGAHGKDPSLAVWFNTPQ